MKKTRILSMILVIAMIVSLAALSGCGSSEEAAPAAEASAVFTGKDINNEEIKIAFIPLAASGETMVPTLEAYDYVLSSYPKASYQVFDPQFDVNTQLKQMNECITQGFDAIIMQCTDANAVNATITEAEEAGIPVITQNIGCSGVRTAHVMNADYQSGYDAAKYLDENNVIADDANVVILDCVAEIKPVCTMGTGFHDYTGENTGWTILAEQPIEGTSQENAYTAMRDLLTKYDRIDAVYAINDACAIGAIQAIEAAGRTDDGIIVWGYEGQPAALKAIRDGSLYATSYADQFNTSCEIMTLTLFLIESGYTGTLAGKTETPSIVAPTVPCTADNIEDIIAKTHWNVE